MLPIRSLFRLPSFWRFVLLLCLPPSSASLIYLPYLPPSSASLICLPHLPPSSASLICLPPLPPLSTSLICLPHLPPSSASLIYLSHLPPSSASLIYLPHLPPSSASLIYLPNSLKHSFFTHSSFIPACLILPPTSFFPLPVFYIPITALTSSTILRSSCWTHSSHPVFMLPLISGTVSVPVDPTQPNPWSLF